MPAAVTSRRVWIPAVGLLVVLSLLPARWCGYGPPLRGVALTLLSPLSGPLTALRGRVRQQVERPVLAGGDLAALSDEIRYKDTLILAMEKRINDLQLVIAEMQGLRAQLGQRNDFLRARVIGRGSDASSGVLHLDRGTRHGVRDGMAAVVGANLVGRIIQAGPTSSTLKPLTGESWLKVVVAPPELPRDGLPEERRRAAQLRPEGPRLLSADDADERIPAEAGDYARLDDDDWPPAVQGMIVGRVSRAEANPDLPLRQRIEVQPMLRLRHVDTVTIIIPDHEGAAESAGAGGAAASRAEARR